MEKVCFSNKQYHIYLFHLSFSFTLLPYYQFENLISNTGMINNKTWKTDDRGQAFTFISGYQWCFISKNPAQGEE